MTASLAQAKAGSVSTPEGEEGESMVMLERWTLHPYIAEWSHRTKPPRLIHEALNAILLGLSFGLQSLNSVLMNRALQLCSAIALKTAATEVCTYSSSRRRAFFVS